MTFLEFLLERTYGDKSAPHYAAFQEAIRIARESGSDVLLVRKLNPETDQFEYAAVGPGQQVPEEYDIWANVDERGKIRRTHGMY